MQLLLKVVVIEGMSISSCWELSGRVLYKTIALVMEGSGLLLGLVGSLGGIGMGGVAGFLCRGDELGGVNTLSK